MNAFRHPSPDEMDSLLRTARHARSEMLAALFARLWIRLVGRLPTPATATHA